MRFLKDKDKENLNGREVQSDSTPVEKHFITLTKKDVQCYQLNIDFNGIYKRHLYVNIEGQCVYKVYTLDAPLREAAKKSFFSGPATKALPSPPPSSLVVTFFGNTFLGRQKKICFLSCQPPPLLLVAGPLKRMPLSVI